MLLDFEVRTCSRCCTQSGKAIEPGEVYFSVLVADGADTVRQDYSAEAWQGASEESLGWWRSCVPVKDAKPKLAPTDVMLNLFIALADKPTDAQFRYLLGLLLIRRRILRRDDSFRNEADQEVLLLFCTRRDEQYEMVVDEPNQEQAVKIQQRMIDLLYGDSDPQPASSATPHSDSPNSDTEAA